MKTFLPGIVGLIFLISTDLYAQNAQTRSEEVERAVPGNITTNYDNSGKDLSCHLMMNPAMVEESEEAIEQFILGETGAALSVPKLNYAENSARDKAAESQEFTTNSHEALLGPTLTSSSIAVDQDCKARHRSAGSYITRAAKAIVSYLACSSMLPQTLAQSESAFAVYSGLSTDQITPTSLTVNADGSYNMGGFVEGAPNSLLGKLNATGKIEWFYEQESSLYPQITGSSNVVMDGALYTSGTAYPDPSETVPYISKNSLNNGALLSTWVLLGLGEGYGSYIRTILNTINDTLICFGYGESLSKPIVLEFDPDSGGVLFANSISFPDNGYIQSATQTSDGSYLIGGNTLTTPYSGWLSKISYNGTAWDSVWMRLYNNPGGIGIYSIAEQNNTVIFAGSIGSGTGEDGFIGSINGTTGASNWITSIGGVNADYLDGIVFNGDSFLNNANKIMAVGNSGTSLDNTAAWYVLMDLNNGTLSKSAILDGSGSEYGQTVVANNDGTFTSLGTTASYGSSSQNLMFVTFDENGEIDPSILPSTIYYSDNTANMTVGSQTVTSSGSNLTFSPVTLTATDVTSSFSTVNDPITAVWQEETTAQPTIQPTRQPTGEPMGKSSSNSSSIIIGGSVGGAAAIALMCALRKYLARDYLKKNSPRSMESVEGIEFRSSGFSESSVESFGGKAVMVINKIPVQGLKNKNYIITSTNPILQSQLDLSVRNASNIPHDIESNSSDSLNLVTEWPSPQGTEPFSPISRVFPIVINKMSVKDLESRSCITPSSSVNQSQSNSLHNSNAVLEEKVRQKDAQADLVTG